MSDKIRELTVEGAERFADYIRRLQAEPTLPPPFALLNDDSSSSDTSFTATIEREPGGKLFSDRHAFGGYLANALREARTAEISLNYRLWNWLALYYFDQLCPMQGGRREVRESSAYCLPPRYRFNRYYRHLVRTPWIAVKLHPVSSRAVLIPRSHKPPSISVRGEIAEQVLGRQGVFRSKAVLEAIDKLYFDERTGRPRAGTAGGRGGSPRRLGKILKQFALTYDLEYPEAGLVSGLLPSEFDRWRA